MAPGITLRHTINPQLRSVGSTNLHVVQMREKTIYCKIRRSLPVRFIGAQGAVLG